MQLIYRRISSAWPLFGSTPENLHLSESWWRKNTIRGERHGATKQSCNAGKMNWRKDSALIGFFSSPIILSSLSPPSNRS